MALFKFGHCIRSKYSHLIFFSSFLFIMQIFKVLKNISQNWLKSFKNHCWMSCQNMSWKQWRNTLTVCIYFWQIPYNDSISTHKSGQFLTCVPKHVVLRYQNNLILNFFFAVSTSFGNSTESKLLVFVMKMQRKCLTRIKVKSSALTGTLATRTMEWSWHNSNETIQADIYILSHGEGRGKYLG